MEVDKVGEDLVANPETELPSLLVTISDLFSTIEASIGHLHAVREVYIDKVVHFGLFPSVFMLLLTLITMSRDFLMQNWSVFAA